MSAGSKIVQLRDALIDLLPHATHTLKCPKYPCTCNLERAISTARALTKVDPARTGGRAALFLLLLIPALIGCRVDRIVLAPPDTVTVHDTVKVPLPPHTDTLIVTRVDTLVRSHTDTLYRLRVDTVVTVRVDTVASPPVHDTTIAVVVRVDTLTRLVHDTTYLTRTDTLYLPSVVVHDSTWVYVQQGPTNPVGGGDPKAGLAWVQIYTTYWLVFWHGNFVGVVYRSYDQGCYAYLYTKLGGNMPLRGIYPTMEEAAQALIPFVLVLHPSSP
jgi:hypothetical protein